MQKVEQKHEMIAKIFVYNADSVDGRIILK
jgi:hypothetical protein